MQVSIQRPSEGLVHSMTVSVAGEGLKNTVELRLKEIQKTVRMDGFRPGKVPMNMVRQRHYQQAHSEAVEELLYATFQQAVKQEGFNVAGILGFSDVSANDGEDFKFTASFDIYPEITLPEFSSLTMEKIVADIKDSDIDAMIEKLRDMRKTFEKSNAAAQSGDMVNIDFSGSLDGVKFDGGSAENVPLVLGSGRMIPGFEDGIIGMTAGEAKVINVTFPEAYQAAHLAGKETQFNITVNSVQTAKLPEVDTDFIKTFGVEDGTVESFRADVRKNLERQVSLSLIKENKDVVMNALSASVSFSVPESLVVRESRMMAESMRDRMRQQGANPDQMPMNPEMFKADAEKRVLLGLLLGEVINKHQIKPSDEKVREILALEAEGYDDPEQFMTWYLSDRQRRMEVEGIALENAVVDFVMSQAKVTEVPKSLDALAG